MPLTLNEDGSHRWEVRKIVVIGPGIVGMPMAAMLARAAFREGTNEPAQVVVIQRNSPTSGWKVDAINAGQSPIGGVEPGLDDIVRDAWTAGLLKASHDYEDARDADVILICVQTDKKGLEPDYGPLHEALTRVAEVLKGKPAENCPLVIFESTLAPSTMTTIIRDHFAGYGLIEGKDILLGNSPNRVMPGRLVERVVSSDKLAAGLHPVTPHLIGRLYDQVVTDATVLRTNSLTAEVVKTLENAYRDVRIAYAAEVVRYCDAHDIDFFALREAINERVAQTDAASYDAGAVPQGAMLVPTIGVGGHCLPKDGILLWWRAIESGTDTSKSLIIESRRINDESPAHAIALAEGRFGSLADRPVALLGAAYRFDSEDTRNSPTLALARLLLERGCEVRIHDPYVKPDDQNLVRFDLQSHFTQDPDQALSGAGCAILCTGHAVYRDAIDTIAGVSESGSSEAGRVVVDGCNFFHTDEATALGEQYVGIGRGTQAPDAALVDAVYEGFRAMETGVANELAALVAFFNEHYVTDEFNRLEFEEVQRLAGTCTTGCAIANPGPVGDTGEVGGFRSHLVRLAREAAAG